MSAKRLVRNAACAALFAVCAAGAAGCYVEDDYPPPAYGYEPSYYNGAVVYYDDYGRPYYYADDRVVWVPPTAPVYVGLVNHWHYYHPYYHRWYSHYGYRYRGWRRR
jgi:hypothetical protein